ncbi:MAG: cobalt-precorrin-6A reductase [Tardiphaga sp.]|nr:cobalt-precorrin-6A reductase [Tardiphaga sp.]
MRILILGGTSGARALAQRVAGDAAYQATLSLAGRTRNPWLPPIPFRIGGFGGVDGLRDYLAAEAIEAVIDATHPFAVQMSDNARLACATAQIPLAALTRPEWEAQAGDRWIVVDGIDAVGDALGDAPRRVLLTHGRLGLAAFARRPQHDYIVRTIDRPDDIELLPKHRLILERGPFDTAAELRLLRNERIDIIVSKNSGGTATYPKIEAARELGLAVVMIRRPHSDAVAELFDVDSVMTWLAAHRTAP